MNVLQKGFNGVALVPLESKLLSARKVYLSNEIDSALADEFMREITFLTQEDNSKPISIYINSPGGEVQAGLLIYDIIKSVSAEINLYCTEMAASMAAIILAGGQRGHRFILPHSRVMIHEPLIGSGFGGNSTAIKQKVDSLMEVRDLIVDLLITDTGKSKEKIEEAISFDNYMNAQQAVEFGICDQVITTFE